MLIKFSKDNLKNLWKPESDSGKGDNGEVTIIGGSELFQGAPLMALMAASRMVDSVFIATPDEDKEIIDKTEFFSKLRSVIWVPRQDVEAYINKSDAVLIGPGLMRYHSETHKNDEIKNGNGAASKTKILTERLLKQFPDKPWVIDGGSLQVMDKTWIPKNAILTPNIKEFEILFGMECTTDNIQQFARDFNCVIVSKGETSYVADGGTIYEIGGGNAGLTKGGTGDVQAGLTVGLLAKNPPLLAAATAAFIVKVTADRLFEKVGYNYNADDLAGEVFTTFRNLII